METDWQTGKPPSFVDVEVRTKNGNVRRGELQGWYFVLRDCTDPLQNMVLPSDWIQGWRYRDRLPVSFF